MITCDYDAIISSTGSNWKCSSLVTVNFSRKVYYFKAELRRSSLGNNILCFPAELGISYFQLELGSTVGISYFQLALRSLLEISKFPPELRRFLGICDAVDKRLVDLALDLISLMWP